MAPQKPHAAKSFGQKLDQTTEVVGEVARTVARRASPLSIGNTMMILALGAIIAFNKQTILEFQRNSSDLKHLQEAHDKCHAEMAILKERVAALEQKLALR